MTYLTPTDFRRHLFETLDRAAHGQKIAIRTRGGTVCLVPERSLHARPIKVMDPLKPKIKGYVPDDFDSKKADAALRKYMRIPR
jgi:hypothetical protein